MTKLEDVIRERAKRNLSAGGGDRKSGYQELGKAIDEPIHTNEELGKIAGVSLTIDCVHKYGQ